MKSTTHWVRVCALDPEHGKFEIGNLYTTFVEVNGLCPLEQRLLYLSIHPSDGGDMHFICVDFPYFPIERGV